MSLESQISYAIDIVAEFPGVFEQFKKRPQNVFCVYCTREMHPRRARQHVRTPDHLDRVGDYLSSSSDEDSEEGSASSSRHGGAPAPTAAKPTVAEVYNNNSSTKNTVKMSGNVGRREATAAIASFPELVYCSWRPINVYCGYCQKEISPHNAAAHVRSALHEMRCASAGVVSSLSGGSGTTSSTTAAPKPAPAPAAAPSVPAPSELERTAYTAVEYLRRDFGPYFRIENARAIAAFVCTICHSAPPMDSASAAEHGRSAGHKERRRAVEEEALKAAALKAKHNAYHAKHSTRGYGGHGDKPDSAAMARFMGQLMIDLPRYDLPSCYANLVATDFPSREELRASRADLLRFSRRDLSTLVPSWDPFAIAEDLLTDNDNPNQTGQHLLHRFPYPEVCGHLRSLYAAMLHMEEAAAALEMRAYNKCGVHLRPHSGGGHRFEVDMPGVSESRPSVLRGDTLHIHADAAGTQRPGPNSRTYYAYVHFVNLDTIVFSMPRHFSFDPSARYSIVFKPSRTQERKLHRAVKATPNTAMLLRETCTGQFEGVGGVANSVAFRPPIDLSRSEAEAGGAAASSLSALAKGAVATVGGLNEHQQAFIRHVHGPNRLSVLWGPPGTGKTTTLVATIVDTLLRAPRDSSIRLLVCAPSNEAADLIAERVVGNKELAHLAHQGVNGTSKLLIRLPSMSRDPKAMPQSLLPYCPPLDGSGAFTFPDASAITEYKVVVTTLMTCDRLYSVGVRGDHFSHLFVDEAGHATEPLLMIALNTARGGAFGCGTKVVLAGDHKQLGPRITVPTFIEAGLHESPLLRIFNDSVLWADVGTQLLHCYRSHPAIVHLINACYNDTLLATVAAENRFVALWRSAYVQQKLWAQHLRCRGLAPGSRPLTAPAAPILCINHSHLESREEDSPSWMNAFEVDTVADLVFTLWDSKLVTSLEDIAIITPYRKQVQKISDKLLGRMANSYAHSHLLLWHDPRTQMPLRRPRIPMKVATVDSYQGREAKVVIVSCVRSHMDAQRQDARFGLGFLNQPERANVSLSRAKDLLIIVGNRLVLCTDPTWEQYYSRLDAMGEGVVVDVGGPAAAYRTSEFEEEEGEEAAAEVDALLNGAFEEKGGVAREE